MKKSLLNIIIFAGVLLTAKNIAHADQICRPCPFDCRGIGAGSKHCDDRGQQYGQCCVDLDNKGMDQLRYKDQENSARYDNRGNSGAYDNRANPGAYDDRNGYSPGDCPPGFHVNERKCTPEEKSRGCNDMRSPSGLTCVGWNQRRR